MHELGLERAVDEVQGAFDRALAAFRPEVRVRSEGHVRSVADGVLCIAGLREAALDDVLLVDERERALVLGLERDEVHAVLLDDVRGVREGARVRESGEIAEIPVGDPLFGRVIDPLGAPIDGAGPLALTAKRPLHREAPQISERSYIRRPLYTGVLAIDAMFPIGRGQRELLLGDQGTGKTSLALDILLRQTSTGVVGIYVAVGRKRSEIARVARTLFADGGSFVVVAAPEDTSPGMRYLAPYAGCAIGEFVMERGGDAVIVYDDLSAHAIAWRELSLLMRRPPGREAYPGDIFYQHSRLLERATQLSAERGGGSLTALPIAQLESGRLSAYIPTNLISITDGQIVFSHALFASGQKPAIDAALSVSRVGGKAQPQAIATLARHLRLDFAAFLELEAFSRLASHLDPVAERRLETGRRIRTLLRGRRLCPLPLLDEVAILALVASPDLLLSIPQSSLGELGETLAMRLRAVEPALCERIETEAVLSDADRRALLAAVAGLLQHDTVEPLPREGRP